MRRREYAALTGPSLLVMGVLLILPLYRTIRWSLERVRYGEDGVFVGLDNYREALSDPRFGRAVLFTVGITLVVTAMVIVGGYVLAVLVNRLGRIGRPLALGALLVPYVVPGVVGSTMISWLFDPSFGGIVNAGIRALTGQEVLWFTGAWPNRLLLALAMTWAMLPFAMLVLLAGLQGVDEDVIEAARLDGASGWRLHWHVLIPSVRGVMGFTVIIAVMDLLRVFDPLIPLSPQAQQIGNESVMLYIYSVAFQDGGQQLGLGSAVNVLLIALIALVLTPFMRSTIKEGQR